MYRYKCIIAKIVDGDTIDVDIDLGFDVWMRNERIRIKGIDAPESRTRDLEEKKCGLLAKQFVENILPVGSSQILVTEKSGLASKGKFNRTLGRFEIYDPVTDRMMFLGDMMIREHLAVPYSGQNKEEIQEQHLVNRQILRERGMI